MLYLENRFVKYIKSTFIYMNIIQIKNNKKLVQMSCAAYIVYTFHLSFYHANFGQFKAKLVLWYLFCLSGHANLCKRRNSTFFDARDHYGCKNLLNPKFLLNNLNALDFTILKQFLEIATSLTLHCLLQEVIDFVQIVII